MKQDRRMLHRFRGMLEMSSQPMPGIPIVELCGEKRLLVENHHGVVSYGDKQIRIAVKFGNLAVSGSGLKICFMSKQQLVVSGRIDTLQLERS